MKQKMMMNNKLYCSKCCELTDYSVKEEKEILYVLNYPIEVNSKITYCNKCGNKIFNQKLDDKNLKKAYDIYRQRHSLLKPSEIKEIRNSYNISSETFSKILGLDEDLISRYENGTIQKDYINNLILLSSELENFIALYYRIRYKLSLEEIELIDNMIKEKTEK